VISGLVGGLVFTGVDGLGYSGFGYKIGVVCWRFFFLGVYYLGGFVGVKNSHNGWYGYVGFIGHGMGIGLDQSIMARLQRRR
jgi:hypothetical protein